MVLCINMNLAKTIQCYNYFSDLIAKVCDGDRQDMDTMAKRYLWKIEDLEEIVEFMKECEDLGIHIIARKQN